MLSSSDNLSSTDLFAGVSVEPLETLARLAFLVKKSAIVTSLVVDRFVTGKADFEPFFLEPLAERSRVLFPALARKIRGHFRSNATAIVVTGRTLAI